jgi:hypothetical protein
LAPKIVNNTFAGNAGSGISSATNFIKGCLVQNNLVLENNYGISVDSVVTTTNFAVGCNDVWANYRTNWVYCPSYGILSTNNLNGTPSDAGFNIAADPLLGGIDGYRLTAGSPAVDAGRTNSSPATDAEGRARLGPPDLGCYELPSPLLTPSLPPAGGSFGVVVTGGRGTKLHPAGHPRFQQLVFGYEPGDDQWHHAIKFADPFRGATPVLSGKMVTP